LASGIRLWKTEGGNREDSCSYFLFEVSRMSLQEENALSSDKCCKFRQMFLNFQERKPILKMEAVIYFETFVLNCQT
jgi:hypothetical protein